jgi:hypothetical protein
MMSLSEQGRGLLQAIQTQSSGAGRGIPRFVTPGQFVTHHLLRAIDNLKFDRNININDQFGLGGADELFTMLNDRGFGFLLPAGNNPSGLLETPSSMGGGQGGDAGQNPLRNAFLNGVRPPQSAQPGGDFGIGQGPLPPFGDPRLSKRLPPPLRPVARLLHRPR